MTIGQDEFDLFMEKALTATSKIVRLQFIMFDAMSKAGVYGGRVDETGMLKMVIAGTDDTYAAADAELNSIYTKINKAGDMAAGLSSVNDF